MRFRPYSLLLCVACSPAPPVPAVAPPLADAERAPEPKPKSDVSPLAVASASSVLAPLPPSGPRVPAPFTNPPESSRRGPTPRLREQPGPPLKQRWSAKVGRTTFRTTMAVTPHGIVIGTHGATLDKSNEKTDGVYVLTPQTGKQLRFIATPGTFDKDVGGIAIDGVNVVFGTDNGLVVKASLSTGEILWKVAVKGKVRPAPALGNLDGRGALDVVVGDEAGDLHALDGDTGSELWTKQTGENDYEARGFIAAAAIGDLNGDGIDDAIAGARDGVLVAYDGRSGAELWQSRGGSGIHASPSLVDVDGDQRWEVLAAWSYSDLVLFDAISGAERYRQALEQDSMGIEGLFGSPVLLPGGSGAPGFIVQGTSWWGGHRKSKERDSVDGVVLATQRGRAFRTNEGRVTSTAVVMDLEDDGVWEAVLGTEDGELLALGVSGTRRSLASLGGPIEASALVADVDADGRFELLVASNDGWLRCFETGSRTPPLLSRFRGNSNDNRGQLPGVDLRFVR